MDPRYKNVNIFNRRKEEWNRTTIGNHITRIFKTVNVIEGWKFVSAGWVSQPRLKRNEELKKHIVSSFKIVLNDPHDKEVSYNILIPDLISEQFFYIGGHLKVPIFQLFDNPIIFRNNLLKLRTNTISISMDLSRDSYKVSVFNKQVPIDLLITSLYTKEEFEEFIEDKLGENPILISIYNNCAKRWDTPMEDKIIELGTLFSSMNTDKTKKGKSVLFSFKAAFEVDFFSREFFKTDSLLFEILNAIYEGEKSDTDITRKRLRFSEYVLSPLIRKVYDMLLTLYNSKKVKFQIPQSIIIDKCSVSEIIHYNFPINPIGEIASLCQISLTGPGGFRKNNVPAHLRDIDISQLGYICGADTPDREGCGVILNMVPTVDINENGSFGVPDANVITSYPISNVPFLEHDDPVRLQMASNQMKQSLLIRDSQKPLIKSGVEKCYLENTTFLFRADQNGTVTHIDPNLMIVTYDDKTSKISKLAYKSLYLGAVDYILPKLKENDNFVKGQTLSSSMMIKEDELAIGQNLLTGVAIWKGFNYEDAIVISEKVSKKRFTSLHSVDIMFTIEPGQVLLSLSDDRYSPLPSIGEFLKKGDVCAKIKTLDGEDGFESVNIEAFEIITPIDCKIVDIEIYPNSWNKKVEEFDLFIQAMSIKQTDKYINMQSKLSRYMQKEEVENFVTLNGLSKLDCASRTGKYTTKGKKFGGIIIKILAVYEEQIGIGDKIANRHGNKGVIAKIIPDEMMPSLPDGRKLDAIINPLGIISRMNAGQLYELHLNEALYQLKKRLYEIKERDEKIEFLKGFLDIIDNSYGRWVSVKILSDYILGLERDNIEGTVGRAESEIYLIQPPFQSIGPEKLFNAMKYTGAKLKYKVFDPSNKMHILNLLGCGYIYFLKLIHRSSDKISARSIGPYSKKTLQPLGGKSRMGGHRLGEMETWSLIAHGADDLLTDFLTLQSDSAGLKNKFLSEVLQNPDLFASNTSDDRPQSLRLFEAYLRVLGLKIEP